MAERFVLSEEAVTQTVGVITGLIERVDRIGTTEGRMEGDLGAVYEAVADGEEAGDVENRTQRAFAGDGNLSQRYGG